MSQYSRKRRLIKSSLQLRLISVFFSIACLASIFQVFMINRAVVSAASQLPSGGTELLALLPEVVKAGLVVTLCVLMPAILFIGVMATHRVAGPVYRFEQYLRGVAMGEADGACSLRKGDEMQDLCDLLNLALERTRERALTEGAETVAPAFGQDLDDLNEAA